MHLPVLPMNISGVGCLTGVTVAAFGACGCAPLSSGALLARPKLPSACKLLDPVGTKLEPDLHKDGCRVEIAFA
jgi:hypothetical protein